MPIRVVAVEDHPLMLKAVTRELDTQDDIQIVGTATHGNALHRLVRETSPDVVVLDLGMSGEVFEPITTVKELRRSYPEVQILVLTGYEDGTLMRKLIGAGVQGYVFKSDDLSLCLPDGVRALHKGERFYSPTVTNMYFAGEGDAGLSERELAILRMAAQGLSNASIGQALGLSEKTVRNYFSGVYTRLGIVADGNVNPRMAAVNKAREMGLV